MKNGINLVGELKLEFESNWGIGSPSHGYSLSDSSILRINFVSRNNNKYQIKDKIWIPGSTLKGTLRAVAMRLDENSCKTANKSEKMCRNCTVCNIFGSPGKMGKIRLNSAFTEESLKTINQPHVMIDRQNRSSLQGHLFYTERVKITSIHTRIIAMDLTNLEKELLLASLRIWGNYGIGSNHVKFTVKGLDELKLTSREGDK